MDIEIKNYIDGLDRRSIPWNRMFTAYGTAENYNELLDVLEAGGDFESWKMTFNRISDFEHQSTMFPPAPFVMVFLVRMLERFLQDGNADDITDKLVGQFVYYADVCCDAEKLEHAEALAHFADLLDDEYLLPEECTEEDLEEIFENPEAVSDELFYSFYYYMGIVLAQVPDILDRYGKYGAESEEIRGKLGRAC